MQFDDMRKKEEFQSKEAELQSKNKKSSIPKNEKNSRVSPLGTYSDA